MGVLLVVAIPFVLAAIYALWQRTRWYGVSSWVVGLLAAFGVLFVAVLFTLGVCRLAVNGEVREFLALKATVEAARQNEHISELELAALQQKIIDANKWLASTQYYRRLLWTNIFYPPVVLELEPIR